jgi:hypothetical protein
VAPAGAESAGNGTKVIFDDDIPGDVQTWFVPEARASEFAEGEIVLERPAAGREYTCLVNSF